MTRPAVRRALRRLRCLAHWRSWRPIGGSDCGVVLESSPGLSPALRFRVFVYQRQGYHVQEQLRAFGCATCQIAWWHTRDFVAVPDDTDAGYADRMAGGHGLSDP